ncbi:MAG: hypothetical protein DMF78_23125 [Acidobacteria bacterium]|nr:MAG: hypothetical protein DMF78_23125 [Acidobacteriota bacterium]
MMGQDTNRRPMRRRWIALALFAVAVVGPGPAMLRAGDEREQHRRKDARDKETAKDRKRFAKLDRNHDGVVSQVEWKGSREQFERLDRNHDGLLSREELRREKR